ncbi:MAG: helix-turn-helix domain-containing protein [Candidatus Acidiferrales bacterium]
MSERDQCLKQIDKLTASHALHGSESLCKLLRYLAHHSIEHPGTPLKEYQLATEVFGRPADFDPQLDSTIRVQAGRLRAKLAEYYSSEGVDDAIVTELPKGTYILSFHHRAAASAKVHPGGLAYVDGEQMTPGQASRKWVIAVVVLSVLLAAAIAAILAGWRSQKPLVATAEGEPAPMAFRVFWKPFLTSPEEPLVIYSNAEFVGRPETGLRYYNPARDAGKRVFDHYTGVGEVLAVHNLDGVFGLLHRQIIVKRGSLFTLDDANHNDLIFVGSPSENLTLREIPGTKEFVFQRMTSGPRKGDLAIVNVHPDPGEQTDFLASPATSPLTEDYAVVALMHGLNPARSVLILAGTTTFGTEGVVEYVCRQESVQELLLRLSVGQAGEIKPFEALIRVKVTHGVPVQTELVALRERKP